MSDIGDDIFGYYNLCGCTPRRATCPPNAFEQKSAINQPLDISEIT